LGVEGERLTEIHPNQAEDIRSKQAEIEQNWDRLHRKVNYSGLIYFVAFAVSTWYLMCFVVVVVVVIVILLLSLYFMLSAILYPCTLEIDVYVRRYAVLVVLARNEHGARWPSG